MIIDKDGSIIDILITDKNGQVERKITVPIDRRYHSTDESKSVERGTITVIAYKKG